MKLYRLVPVLVLLWAAACGSNPTPTALPATSTALAPTAPAAATAAATATASPEPSATPTQAPNTPTATLQPATATASATVEPATATSESSATPLPSPTPTQEPATETPVPPTPPAPGTIIGQHVVQPGETLFCIARGYGVLPAAIAQANGLGGTMSIFPGQKLSIPAVQWTNVPPGPVCAPQFTSPFPGLGVTPITATVEAPTATLEPSSTSLPSPTLPQFLPTVTPVPFTPLPPAPIIGQHVVQRGETIFCIGRGYGVLPAAIAQANGLGQELLIFPGQLLNIPAVQWFNIALGPVCAPQFASPFPGLPVEPTATATLAAGSAAAAPQLAVTLDWRCVANCGSNSGSYVVRVVVHATGSVQPYTYNPSRTYDVTLPHCTTGQGTVAVTSAAGKTSQASWSYHDTACP